jgi:MFS family permease
MMEIPRWRCYWRRWPGAWTDAGGHLPDRAQSALFAPAHYGILPEILPESAISRANGLDQLCTFIAIVIGAAAGGAMSDAWGNDVSWIGGMLMVIAVMGSLTSLWISRGAAPASHRLPQMAVARWSRASGGSTACGRCG